MKDIRYAAGQWFEQDKSRFLRQNRDAEILLAWIVDKVLGEKRARAFLVESGSSSNLLDDLYDGRVLHVLKRSVSAHDQPGRRYIVYKIDYGCYVDVLTTAKAPQGLLPGIAEDGEETFVEVPPDDYRSIRRSILDVRQFDAEQMRRRVREFLDGSGETAVGKWLRVFISKAVV